MKPDDEEMWKLPQVPDAVTDDTPEDAEKQEATQGAEPEGPTETAADHHENKDESNVEPAEPESSEVVEGDLPDEVRHIWKDAFKGRSQTSIPHLQHMRQTGPPLYFLRSS